MITREMVTRALVPAAFALFLAAVAPVSAPAAEPATEWTWTGYEWIRDLMGGSERQVRRSQKRIEKVGDESFVAPLVDALFFVRREDRGPMVDTLESLTGARLGADYYGWVEWVGAREGLPLPPDYLAWKSSLFSRIDPRYTRILRAGAPLRIRPEEIVWGGVPVEGIPALDRPPAVAASESALAPGDEVFGVEIGGESRAYPVKVLSWHEMANDRLGGRSVTLSFCTLCGSAILFDAESAGGVRAFGTSGLLYRSNKLMIDRDTLSLWSNLTGEAVVGPLAAEPARLRLLPMVRTRWDEWRRLHPDTSVLDVAALTARYRFDYRPGAADEARTGVSFPVWQTSDALPRRAEVFVLRLGGAAKVYPLDLLPPETLVHDRVGEIPVLLVMDAAAGVRAYRRGSQRFRWTEEGVVDEEGCAWAVTEPALEPCAAKEGVAALPRLPGHGAFWFGWYGTVPGTEVFDGIGEREEPVHRETPDRP